MGDTKRSFSAATGEHFTKCGITLKRSEVAVTGVKHRTSINDQAEPQAMAVPARGASEATPYLRSSALANTCEALAMYLPSPCAGCTSTAHTDQTPRPWNSRKR